MAESQTQAPEVDWMWWFLPPADCSLPILTKASPLVDEELNCTCSSSFTAPAGNPGDESKSVLGSSGLI